MSIFLLLSSCSSCCTRVVEEVTEASGSSLAIEIEFTFNHYRVLTYISCS